MDVMVLLGVTPYPEDKTAIADIAINGKQLKLRMKEINKEWLQTDVWWPMHKEIEPIYQEGALVARLFGADRIDFKLVGIRRYLCMGFARFRVIDQNVRGIYN